MSDMLKAILAIAGLLGSVWAFWLQGNNEEKKRKEEQDAKIDAATNATELLRAFDRLHK